MKCKNCQIEYKSKRETSQFCSAKCRKDYWKKNAKEVSVLENGKVSVPVSVPEVSERETYINRWGKDVREMDAETLYAYIGAYEQDTWKDSPEFKELSERLKKPLKWLKENKYWIPNRLAFKC